MVNGSWLMPLRRLMAHASRLVAQISWLMAKKIWRQGPGPGDPALNFSWPRAMSLEARALRHEP